MGGLVSIVNSVLNVKAVVAAFNQEKKALVGAFSVIVHLHQLIGHSTSHHHDHLRLLEPGQ